MKINPQSVILPDAPLSNHTIRVDIQWSPANLPGWILYYDLDCDQNNHSSTTSTTGTNTYSLTSPGYENYQIQFRFGSLDPNQPTITGTYQIYYDEQLIRSASFQAQPASYSNFAYFNTHYQSPVLTDYTFSIYTSEICPGRYEDIYLTTSRNCNATAEINTEQDSITLTIETGKEFVSFYKNNQKKDTVTFMYHELGSVYLRQDSIYTGTASINVNIESNWTGIIKNQQLVINPQEQFQIRVPDQPRIVFSGGVGALMIEPYSTSICPPYVSENLRYTALIKKGSSRGLLYDYDTGQSGDTLTNLTPQEDGEKYLDFITEGEILNEEDTLLIKIFANNENIDTTEAVVIIYPNNLDVQIIPPVIQQGDTASVVLKKRGVNGLEDFAIDKLFNVEIVQGLDYGLILDSLSNDTLTTFSNIPQGFKIIAKDSTGIDSTKIRIKVTTEESGFPVARMIKNKTKTNKKEIVDDNENKKSDDEIITPDWVIPGPILLEGFGDVVVKQDGCNEEIVVCNSYQIPKFEDVGTITVLKSDTTWQWVDSQGTLQTIISINGCNIIKPSEFGITYIMNGIGDPAISQQPIYYSLDDLKVTACADKSNSNPNDHIWRFNVENMRVPIFRDHCPSWAISNGYKDLLDGANADTLAKYITDCNDYSNVMTALDWWWIGPYRQTITLPHLYYFSAGVLAHENIHVKQMKDGGTKAFSTSALSQVMNGPDGLPKMAKYNWYNLNIYKCPEDALNALWGKGSKVIKIKEQIRNELSKALEIASNLKPLGGVDVQLRYKSELEADELARPKYEEIKKNIENWAKQQSWWCFESIGGSFNCDGNKCK